MHTANCNQKRTCDICLMDTEFEHYKKGFLWVLLDPLNILLKLNLELTLLFNCPGHVVLFVQEFSAAHNAALLYIR